MKLSPINTLNVNTQNKQNNKAQKNNVNFCAFKATPQEFAKLSPILRETNKNHFDINSLFNKLIQTLNNKAGETKLIQDCTKKFNEQIIPLNKGSHKTYLNTHEYNSVEHAILKNGVDEGFNRFQEIIETSVPIDAEELNRQLRILDANPSYEKKEIIDELFLTQKQRHNKLPSPKRLETDENYRKSKQCYT